MPSYRIIVIICLVSFSGIACKKTNTNPVLVPKEVAGKWEWTYTYLYNTNSPVNPATPQNTGINEIITYYSNHSWSKIQNNNVVDSGTYSIGHGSRRINPWAVVQYDSIQYYQNALPVTGKVDYYFIIGDSLNFNPGYSGIYSGDSKWLTRL